LIASTAALEALSLMQSIAAQREDFFMNSERSLKRMINAAFLIAISIVLTRLLSITTPFFRIGFGSIPIMIAGIVLGPKYGFVVGGVADLVGFMMNPAGSFMPGFTLTSAMTGAIPGWIWGMTEQREERGFSRTLWIIIGVFGAGLLASIFRVGPLRWEGNQLLVGEIVISFVYILATVVIGAILIAATYFQNQKGNQNGSIGRLFMVVTLTNFVCSMGLNTLWLSILFGKGFLVLLPGRIILNLITIPVHTIVLFHLSRTFSYFDR
jgi:ECF transporter S component (folate family)